MNKRVKIALSIIGMWISLIIIGYAFLVGGETSLSGFKEWMFFVTGILFFLICFVALTNSSDAA